MELTTEEKATASKYRETVQRIFGIDCIHQAGNRLYHGTHPHLIEKMQREGAIAYEYYDIEDSHTSGLYATNVLKKAFIHGQHILEIQLPKAEHRRFVNICNDNTKENHTRYFHTYDYYHALDVLEPECFIPGMVSKKQIVKIYTPEDYQDAVDYFYE